MSRNQLVDYLERSVATFVQSFTGAIILGMGWKSAAVGAIGAGLAVLKAAAKDRLAKPEVSE
jgi:hypothetical protein